MRQTRIVSSVLPEIFVNDDIPASVADAKMIDTPDRLQVRLVEFHVVHHCNLTCQGCSHFSPSARKHIVSLDELAEQFERVAQRIQPEVVHLLGGEPLLHPELPSVLKLARSAFCDAVIKLVSNGVLVERRGTELAEALAINRVIIAVSLYPGTAVNRDEIARTMTRAGAAVEFWKQDTFIDFLSPIGDSDPRAARAQCPMGDSLNVRDDRLYPCPVSAWSDFGGVPVSLTDGVCFTETRAKLAAVLDPERITSKCRYCRCSPKRRAHAMGSRRPLLLTEAKQNA